MFPVDMWPSCEYNMKCCISVRNKGILEDGSRIISARTPCSFNPNFGSFWKKSNKLINVYIIDATVSALIYLLDNIKTHEETSHCLIKQNFANTSDLLRVFYSIVPLLEGIFNKLIHFIQLHPSCTMFKNSTFMVTTFFFFIK